MVGDYSLIDRLYDVADAAMGRHAGSRSPWDPERTFAGTLRRLTGLFTFAATLMAFVPLVQLAWNTFFERDAHEWTVSLGNTVIDGSCVSRPDHGSTNALVFELTRGSGERTSTIVGTISCVDGHWSLPVAALPPLDPTDRTGSDLALVVRQMRDGSCAEYPCTVIADAIGGAPQSSAIAVPASVFPRPQNLPASELVDVDN